MFIILFCSPEQQFVYFNMNWNTNTNRKLSNLFAFLQQLATGPVELRHLIQALAKHLIQALAILLHLPACHSSLQTGFHSDLSAPEKLHL